MASLTVSVRKVRFDMSGGVPPRVLLPRVPPGMYAFGIGGLFLLSSCSFCLSENSGFAAGGAPADIGMCETTMPGELSSLFA